MSSPVDGELWLPTGVDFVLTPSVAGPTRAWWTADPVTVSTADSPVQIAITEKTATVRVKVNGLAPGEVAQVQVSPTGDQTGTGPASNVVATDADGVATFQLPYGPWLLEGDWAAGPGSALLTLDPGTYVASTDVDLDPTVPATTAPADPGTTP